jgi:hypothetical protein
MVPALSVASSADIMQASPTALAVPYAGSDDIRHFRFFLVRYDRFSRSGEELR